MRTGMRQQNHTSAPSFSIRRMMTMPMLTAGARFVPSDTATVSAYYFSPLGKKDNLVIFNVDKLGKLVWQNTMALSNEPFDVKFNEAIFETILYFTDPAVAPTDNSPQYLVIGRTGRVRK